MFWRCLLTLAALGTWALPVCAQTPEISPTWLAEFFLQGVISGEAAAAFDSIAAASPSITDEAKLAMFGQLTALTPILGEPLGFEKSSETYFSESLVRLIYLVNYEKQPIAWEFYFYRPKDQWFLVQVFFYDQFNRLPSGK